MPLLHHLPVVPSPFADHRPAPKYGGPPFASPSFWIPVLIVLGVAAAGVAWLLR
jgi:hypothetical protein